MKVAIRVTVLALVMVLAFCLNSVHAAGPTTIPAWYNGEIVQVIPGVSDNVVGVTHRGIVNHAANPLYVAAGQEVNHVLGVAIPGVAGYNPYWDLVFVTVTNGRDLAADPFTSEVEILEAAANGEVTLDDSGIILLCQVVSK